MIVAAVWPQRRERSVAPTVPELRQLLARLLGNFTLRSYLFRHGLRLAITTTLAQALTMILHLGRGYWMTLTVAIVLQPVASATFERAMQRVVGTVIGGLLAAVLAGLAHRPVALASVLIPLTILTIAVRPIGYAYFSMFVTPLFILIVESSTGNWNLVPMRIEHPGGRGAGVDECGPALAAPRAAAGYGALAVSRRAARVSRPATTVTLSRCVPNRSCHTAMPYRPGGTESIANAPLRSVVA